MAHPTSSAQRPSTADLIISSLMGSHHYHTSSGASDVSEADGRTTTHTGLLPHKDTPVSYVHILERGSEVDPFIELANKALGELSHCIDHFDPSSADAPTTATTTLEKASTIYSQLSIEDEAHPHSERVKAILKIVQTRITQLSELIEKARS